MLHNYHGLCSALFRLRKSHRTGGTILWVLITATTMPAGRTKLDAESRRHPATISEILSLRRPTNVQISPDGTLIAYVVTQPVLDLNEEHAELNIVPVSPSGRSLTLAAGTHIDSVRWYPNSRTLSYVLQTRDGSQIWRSDAQGIEQEQLTDFKTQPQAEPSTAEAILAYEVSPDGTRVAYTMYDVAGVEGAEKRASRGGALYTGGFTKPLSYLDSRRVPIDLWLYDLHHHATRKIWTLPTFAPRGAASIPEFQWSQDGTTLALLYQNLESERYTLALLDVSGERVRPLLRELGFSHGLKWSDDGRSLIFYSEGILKTGDARRTPCVYSFQMTDSSLHEIASDRNSLRASFEGLAESAIAVEQAVEKQKGDLLSSCSLDIKKSRAACVREAPSMPPEIATVDLGPGLATSSVQILTHLNPGYDSIKLGDISLLTWPNKDGHGSAGLILPVGFVPGKRYPLLVMLYNLFTGRRFIADAGGFTSYPAQAFAGHGYVVLLMNVPRYYVYAPGNFRAARQAEVDSVIADVHLALDVVARRGIIDTAKMGLMGWSGGCFWTNYAVTRYPEWFHAAASGECAIHYPGQYWLGDDHWRKMETGFFGGGPYGQYYSRWKQISPVLNVNRLKVPLLMEYTGFYPAGLEMRTAILEQGGQSELVIYADDEHVLQKPLNRFNSMTRHYDWFNFWLLGEEDPDSRKLQQYVRWREMRAPMGKISTKTRKDRHSR